MIELLAGFGIAWFFNAGAIYVFFLCLSFLFPRFYKFFWYVVMFPLLWFVPAFFIFLGGMIFGAFSWALSDYFVSLFIMFPFTCWLCSSKGIGPGAG